MQGEPDHWWAVLGIVLILGGSKDVVLKYYFGTNESHCTDYTDYIVSDFKCASTSNFQKESKGLINYGLYQ